MFWLIPPCPGDAMIALSPTRFVQNQGAKISRIYILWKTQLTQGLPWFSVLANNPICSGV